MERTERGIMLCGNPNVGKSTLFNSLTNLHQHTGNWPGKTVGSAVGAFSLDGTRRELVDLPGSYSLLARSAEEEVTRDYVLFHPEEDRIVVCDATCLARGLLLVLQVLELGGRVGVCVNLMDEAARKGIELDLPALSDALGVPVCGISAGRGAGMDEFFRLLRALEPCAPQPLPLDEAVEAALLPLSVRLEGLPLPAAYLARALVQGDESLCESLHAHLSLSKEDLAAPVQAAREALAAAGLSAGALGDAAAAAADKRAAEICRAVVHKRHWARADRDERIDRVLTHRLWGVPAMVALLALTLWITMVGANAPSELLCRGLFALGERLRAGLVVLHSPAWLTEAVCDGVWRTTAWVIGVMLPPMLIFFPLFTLLEDLGYLPRVAFNLDGAFAGCGACGKQGLCMCMGLGCNAVGVRGCRIIDSPRERLIAVLTNSFMPCNGRFPMLIALLTVFFSAGGSGRLVPAVLLTGVLLLGVGMTFLVSAALSRTLLRGESSSFTLELPPYRMPRLGQVLLRSVVDRTLFVLGRAVSVAAPAGLLIWVMGRVEIHGATLLALLQQLLEGPGRALGMDGAILLGFLLALPANEIAIPSMLMCYTSQGALTDYTSLTELGTILRGNGWTAETAVCVVLFTLMHWPCATALHAVAQETGSRRYTLLAALLPTACGCAACLLVRILWRLLVA